MSIRKGTSIIAGNLGQNIDDALSLTSTNPVQNKVITEELETKLGQSDITNCIIKIPQDIKLELNGGALILKSGSKFYYPNGLDGTAPIFNSFTTTSDLTLSVGGTGWTNKEYAILVLNDGTSSVGYACPDDLYSGSNPPTLSTQYACWYDTGSNIIRRTTDSGSTWTSTPYSFPICIAVNTGGNCDSISQIFNGFGYIGSTVFALPGVKGLIPDGRNSDGSLKNVEYITEKTSILNVADRNRSDVVIFIKSDGELQAWGRSGGNVTSFKHKPTVAPMTYCRAYIEDENLWYHCYETTTWLTRDTSDEITELFSVDTDANGISGIYSMKTTFHALDYNDTEFIGHQAMPSSRYINLTLGASGATYTAPADGYVYFERGATSGNKYISLFNTSSGMSSAGITISGISNAKIFLPVKKSDVFRVDYTADTANPTFRFIYAEGAV